MLSFLSKKFFFKKEFNLTEFNLTDDFKTNLKTILKNNNPTKINNSDVDYDSALIENLLKVINFWNNKPIKTKYTDKSIINYISMTVDNNEYYFEYYLDNKPLNYMFPVGSTMHNLINGSYINNYGMYISNKSNNNTNNNTNNNKIIKINIQNDDKFQLQNPIYKELIK